MQEGDGESTLPPWAMGTPQSLSSVSLSLGDFGYIHMPGMCLKLWVQGLNCSQPSGGQWP